MITLTEDRYTVIDPLYKIYEVGLGRYYYRIESGRKIFAEEIREGTEPRITDMGGSRSGIVKLQLGCGTSCRTIQYFDVFEAKTSEAFLDSGGAADFVDINNNLIAYSALSTKEKQKQILIVQDIFDKKLFYKEIDLNFANITSPIENAIFLNENQIYLEYLTPNPTNPEEYDTKTEIIDL